MIRTVAAVLVAVGAGLWLRGGWQVAAYTLAAVLGVTALTGFCGAYRLLGISTCSYRARQWPLVVGALALLSLLLLAAYQNRPAPEPEVGVGGEESVVQVSSSTVQGALLAALEDERRARTSYAAVLVRLGEVRPFSNVIRAEEEHIALLEDRFRARGISIPEDATARSFAPASVAEACTAAVVAERANVALYRETLIPQVADVPDVREVFTALADASEFRHLPAFERCGSR